ncbi:cobaltochelatase CobT-related protein [Porphyrobacter sp. AAP82]|uniref:cobaltochelatase CobT-related protein n=1 Tax=Porphyrobacter sp. AAP82 TaxID=1248917 RepID=UPI0002F6473E|nr:hypothetical protein [Porphyrobacter sp. AAP82]
MSLSALLGAGVALLAAILGCIGILRMIGERVPRPLPPRPPEPRYPEQPPVGPPYHAFTTAFDVVCKGRELERVLATRALNRRASRHSGDPDPAGRRRQFDDGYAAATAGLSDPAADFGGVAVMILLDQSGSMAGRMPRVAGGLLAALERLEAAGATTLLAGFTTIGWHGGRARRQWRKAGRPIHPGRLCDLLHVIYSGPDRPTTRKDLLPLTGYAICFENVDGEAVAWADGQLLALPHTRRCLVVVSDGAPVDDSTLTENCAEYLWDDLARTVAGITQRGKIALGAVGIGHDVSPLYPVARQAGDDDGLCAAILAVTQDLRG